MLSCDHLPENLGMRRKDDVDSHNFWQFFRWMLSQISKYLDASGAVPMKKWDVMGSAEGLSTTQKL